MSQPINKDSSYFISEIYMDKTMADELMYIPTDDTQNYRFHFDTHLTKRYNMT